MSNIQIILLLLNPQALCLIVQSIAFDQFKNQISTGFGKGKNFVHEIEFIIFL
jgi:hypothetical protein